MANTNVGGNATLADQIPQDLRRQLHVVSKEMTAPVWKTSKGFHRIDEMDPDFLRTAIGHCNKQERYHQDKAAHHQRTQAFFTKKRAELEVQLQVNKELDALMAES
jgi:hypothetical protein